ncbi:multicopper oxidase family protein [Cohnella caldifontis]|uniref:multicopper oxidase family protein n=1 Tax=Cohnella caldifontis TaxID=3027471 RepID=UPI0023EDCE64|nr:multicopper oxidase family protein [Cohnella sp. YIM B05605]
MYGSMAGVELGCTLITVLLAWIAGNKASNLVYAGSGRRLRQSIRSTFIIAGTASVFAVAVLAGIFIIAATKPSVYWEDRVLINAPLIGVPLLAVWCYSVPALRRVMRILPPESGAPDAGIRGKLSAPGVVVPFQAAAVGAATALYFVLAAPFPLQPLDAASPLFVCVLAIVGMWMLHDRRWQRVSRPDAPFAGRTRRRTLGKLGALALGFAVMLAAVASGASASRLPDRLDMASGPMDFGGGTVLSHDTSRAVSVAMMTGPREEKPDRRITLTAERKTVRLASGKEIEAWTFNGEVPGPELRLKQGELVEVTLANKDIEAGVTLHWHGLDVPNAEDGVAGATQDAVMPGQTHTYRFRAEQTGTFWYHSHQDSQEAVSKGLFGALIVEPAQSGPTDPSVRDIVVLSHLWSGSSGFAIGTDSGVRRETVKPGTPVRLRLLNTDNWVRQRYRLAGTPFRVAAIDGTELNEPQELRNAELQLTTGGRYDVTFTMPDRPVFLSVGGSTEVGLLMSPDGTGDVPTLSPPASVFDPLHYGKPASTPFHADSAFDRSFRMILDNNLGFYDGQFDFVYTINGRLFPDTPMFMVKEGELIKVTIVNRSAVDHPMHLHGHHALVLSRNGEPSDGSPWWTDTLDVLPGDTYEIAFRADNPGIWMDHCHNLTHAAAGMSMHLMYEGVSTPYTIGTATVNQPE